MRPGAGVSDGTGKDLSPVRVTRPGDYMSQFSEHSRLTREIGEVLRVGDGAGYGVGAASGTGPAG